ncbi:MAG: Arc family DNA-binding protein [Mesorhizobium sp.]|uniref:Arc family DNA-binding protein n=1 Tax=Mesorhizobium sp. TaxID=1871066 RepID=UPI000FE84BFA|nr:Arc family DNA-binding protein [Mesorhizobium sp.]RWL19752.1 MAG: Arc family DNA-binding protein [Mesorhizobium sp.]
MATPKQTDPQFKLRLPSALKDRIDAAAIANNRSINAEIVATLEEKYPAPIAFDHEAFVEQWLMPIMDDAMTERHEALVRAADRAARKIHPNLGVWESAAGKRLALNFGVRDQSLVAPEVRNLLQGIIMMVPPARRGK